MEALVLLPEMMCDIRMWQLQIDQFSKERSVILAPTHLGASVGEVAAQVLDTTPRRFAIAGLGLGGVVAMEVLRRAPERVTRIALMATDALAETPQAAAAREESVIAAKAGRLSEAVAKLPTYEALAPGLARPEIQKLVQDMAQHHGAEAFVRQTRLMQRRPDQQRALRQFQGPILIVGGKEDSIYPEKRLSFLAELAPSARLEILENAGHLPPLEASDRTNELLQNWLTAT